MTTPLTDAMIAEEWDETRGRAFDPWSCTGFQGFALAFAHAIAARVTPAPLTEGLTEERARERERTAFRNGWLAYRGVLTCADNLDMAVDEVYPAGAARGGVVGVDPDYKLESQAAWTALGRGDEPRPYPARVADLAKHITTLRERCDAAESALAEAKRSAREEALMEVAAFTHDDPGAITYQSLGQYRAALQRHVNDLLRPPTPEPPRVVLSDGSVVRREHGRLLRAYEGSGHVADNWMDLLNPTDTGADFDALKQFAAQVIA